MKRLTTVCRAARYAGALLLFAALGVSAAAETAGTVVGSGAGDRRDLALTVYNHDLALVRETRSIEMPDGLFNLEFRDVPERINPRSLLIEVVDGRPIHLLEQDYEYDLMSRQKILEKYVGRSLSWIQEDGSRIEGVLLGMAKEPIFRVDGEILFEVPGRIALPELPENLRARPTLVWRIDAARKGARRLDVSYLTGGLSWSADYVLHVDAEGERGDIQSWVTVDNQSGAEFEDATLMLLAGDIHRAPAPPQPREYALSAGRMKDDMRQPVEESVHDYHLYTLPERTTLKGREVKQLSFFTAADIGLRKHYRLQSRSLFHRMDKSRIQRDPIDIVYAFENSEANNLYRPLPAGTIRVYGMSRSGARQLLGSDRIDHTPRGERIELTVGEAFDLVAKRRQTDYEKRGDHLVETAYEIVLRNQGEAPAVIEVIESVGGDWRVLKATHTYTKVDAQTLRFDVPVPAEGEVVLGYRVSLNR